MYKKLVKIDAAIPEVCLHTSGTAHIDRQTDHGGGVIKKSLKQDIGTIRQNKCS